MKKNNKGFSYVELILVIGVMAILLAIIGISANLVGRTSVTKAASKLDTTLNQARTTSMARGSSRGSIEITRVGGKYYYYVGDVLASDKNEYREELVSTPVQIGYSVDNGEVNFIGDGGSLVIKYDQSSGSFKPLDSGGYCTSIVLTNGSDTSTITLHSLTGKCELN